jgi:hypothetical protein
MVAFQKQMAFMNQPPQGLMKQKGGKSTDRPVTGKSVIKNLIRQATARD